MFGSSILSCRRFIFLSMLLVFMYVCWWAYLMTFGNTIDATSREVTAYSFGTPQGAAGVALLVVCVFYEALFLVLFL